MSTCSLERQRATPAVTVIVDSHACGRASRGPRSTTEYLVKCKYGKGLDGGSQHISKAKLMPGPGWAGVEGRGDGDGDGCG